MRYVAWGILGHVCLFVMAPVAAAEEQIIPAPAFERLRTFEAGVTELLQDGQEKSATFRDLVRTIETSDLIVYVIRSIKLATVGGGVTIGGNVTVRETANGRRLVFALINPLLPPAQTTAMIAHELQHAVEIANAPEIVDHKSLVQHYDRVGIRTGSRSYDTAAARTVQDRVMTELSGDEGTWDSVEAGT